LTESSDWIEFCASNNLRTTVREHGAGVVALINQGVMEP